MQKSSGACHREKCVTDMEEAAIFVYSYYPYKLYCEMFPFLLGFIVLSIVSVCPEATDFFFYFFYPGSPLKYFSLYNIIYFLFHFHPHRRKLLWECFHIIIICYYYYFVYHNWINDNNNKNGIEIITTKMMSIQLIF